MEIKIGKKRRRPFRNTIFAIVLLILVPVAFVWLVNQQWLLAHILRTVNFRSPTQIAVQKFTWNPITSSIHIEGLGIHHEPMKRDGWVSKIDLKYKPIGFLRGKLIISELKLDDVNVILPPVEKKPEKKRRKELNIGRLLLLHSLIIEEATVEKLAIAFAKDSTFRSDELNWSLKPSFTGDTTLVLGGKNITIHKTNKSILNVEDITLETSTRLSRWKTGFPYLNAIKGSVTSSNIVLQGLDMDSVEAEVSYEDGLIDLKDLNLKIRGNELVGAIKVNLTDQSFDLAIDIPKPISLPYLGKPIKTVNTAGELSGKIKLSGKGLVLDESRGSGALDMSHRFSASPENPVRVVGKFSWKKGVIYVDDVGAESGNNMVDVGGTIDVARKRMKLTGKGQRFPIEAIFDKFNNPHLAKIYGETDFEGSFEGWGKKFVAKVKGTTFNGGFKPIVGEKIETVLEATYNMLDFKWEVFQGNRQTGTADLVIKIGPRRSDGQRSKDIDLAAKLVDHQLEPSFPGFNLTGIATGEITLKGPHTNFNGTAKAEVTEGSWLHVPIDFVSTDINLTKPKITFDEIKLKPGTLDEMSMLAPLVMDLTTGKFRLHGEPLHGFQVDLTYTYKPKLVQIAKISYRPPQRPGEFMELKGSVVSGGAMNMSSAGEFDLSLLNPLHAAIREASGPIAMNVRIGGSTTSPSLTGRIQLNENYLSPRKVRLTLEKLKGAVRFEGHRIYFDDINGLADDGSFMLTGWLEHYNFKLSDANVTLDGKEFSFRTAKNTFRMEFDGKLTLTGSFPHPLLAGDVNILDGRYTKDFTILERLAGKGRKAEEQEEPISEFDPRLDLHVHNTGDLYIQNNVGNIDLLADIQIKGTRNKPKIEGSVAVREGRIDYMGLKFDITRGFVEFRGPYAKPYLEVEAERELRLYNLKLRFYGPTDNLALDLEGSSPSGSLEKRDIISLLTFGVTEQERRETDVTRTSQQIGVSVAAQQVGQMLERPVTELTHLDIFRVEAAEEDTESDEPGKIATRLRIGKQLTDRLSVDFATDIDTKDADQTVTGEYLITDNIVLKGSRSSESHYKVNMGLRFRLR